MTPAVSWWCTRCTRNRPPRSSYATTVSRSLPTSMPPPEHSDGSRTAPRTRRWAQARLHPPSFTVEKEAPLSLGLELLIGVKRDRSFGPVALVGLGGISAELVHDLAVALAPVTVEQGVALIRSLRGAELLLG